MPYTAPLEVQWNFAEKLYREFINGNTELEEFLKKVETPTLVMSEKNSRTATGRLKNILIPSKFTMR